MNFNKILQSLFGNKSTRDMKLIQPIVEKIKAEYPKMQALSNDELRAKQKNFRSTYRSTPRKRRLRLLNSRLKLKTLLSMSVKVSSTRSTS